MFGLTSLGVVHTIISLLAVAAGTVALIRDGKISGNNSIGKFYLITTIIVCLTGFGIFQHGGFGKPHVLGIVTLLVIGVVFVSGEKTKLFGKASPFIETISYSMTFFFHLIPAITESATRLPLDTPLASSPDDPRIQMAVGVCFVLFVLGAALQFRRLRAVLRTGG